MGWNTDSTDDTDAHGLKSSVKIRQIRVICVLFQLKIENYHYLSNFEKRYVLNQSKSLTDDQCSHLYKDFKWLHHNMLPTLVGSPLLHPNSFLRIHKAIGVSDAKQRRSYKLKEVRFAADLFLD